MIDISIGVFSRKRKAEFIQTNYKKQLKYIDYFSVFTYNDSEKRTSFFLRL